MNEGKEGHQDTSSRSESQSDVGLGGCRIFGSIGVESQCNEMENGSSNGTDESEEGIDFEKNGRVGIKGHVVVVDWVCCEEEV